MSRSSGVVLVLCFVLFTISPCDAQESAWKWKSKNGSITRATLEGFEITLSLKKEDGKVVEVPFDVLTPTSQAQALRLIQKRVDKSKEANPPPEEEPKPGIEKISVMTAEEVQKLIAKLKEIHVRAEHIRRGRYGRDAAEEVERFFKPTVSKLTKKYGQFRIKLAFPVENVKSHTNGYELSLGRCFLGGFLATKRNQPTELDFYGGKLSYQPIVQLSREEMLSIGSGTHQYEMLALVGVGLPDRKDVLYRSTQRFGKNEICIYYVTPRKIEFKLVKIAK